jgi:hypothetical protein
MCGCSSVTDPLAPSSTAAVLGDLMALVPEDAQVLMGMGSSDRAQVMASAELGTYRGTRLTVVAVCQGEGNLRLALDHGGGMEVSCDQGIATIDIPVTPEARPGTVSIALERGNTYSTLVYSADPGAEGAQQ